MSVNNYLLWEKYRPRVMDDIILLPRIQKEFENGLSQHYILHGHYGTGKTSLARLLIGKYTKSSPFLELNCSIDTSIDILRTEIDDFCKFNSFFESDSEFKYVFLDEFERVSINFQDAFKAFIEKYNKNVRFIITTNHINKIIPGLKSRIKCIDFNCNSIDEERFIKTEFYKKVKNILTLEKCDIDKNSLVNIINKNFPDLRKTLVDTQSFIKTGEVLNDDLTKKIQNDLYKIIYTNSKFEDDYHFLMSNFGAEKIHNMIALLGRPFIDWSIKENKNVEKLFNTSYIISDYGDKLDTSIDPIVLGVTIIGKFKEVLNPS